MRLNSLSSAQPESLTMSIQFTLYFIKGMGVGSLGLEFNFRFVFFLGIVIFRVVLLMEFIPKLFFCHLVNF